MVTHGNGGCDGFGGGCGATCGDDDFNTGGYKAKQTETEKEEAGFAMCECAQPGCHHSNHACDSDGDGSVIVDVIPLPFILLCVTLVITIHTTH